MQRRDFLWILGGGMVACTIGCDERPAPSGPPGPDASPPIGDGPRPMPGDAAAGPDACTPATVKMHDTYAQALYLDGSLGPLTGTIEVEYVLAGATITLDFWHGHNGVLHRYTLEPSHFAQLEMGKRITLPTTIVDDHMHTLFIDPKDEHYRVPGAQDVDVPLDHC
jgi:hypothetical protein